MVGEVQNLQRRQQKWRVLYFTIQSQPFFPANLDFKFEFEYQFSFMINIIIFFFNFFSSLTQLRLTKPLGQSSIFFVSTFFCGPSVNGSWMILENLIHAFVDAIKYVGN